MARQVLFATGLYLPEAVEVAAVEYRPFTDIHISQDGDGMVAQFQDEEVDDEIIHAFCNHVLHETITRKRRSTASDVY